ncbi:MAG: hypothetical protein ACI9IZ_000369, partial [Nonlabens sp.]
MKKFFNSLYLQQRFFIALGILVVLFVFAFFFERLIDYFKIGFFVMIGLLVFDILLLYRTKNAIKASRNLPDKFSNGDQNPVDILVTNQYNSSIHIKIIDELPVQFQERSFEIKELLQTSDSKTFPYTVRPTQRGEYHFGGLQVFASTTLGFAQRKFSFNQDAMVPNYPSFLQLRKYELMAFTNKLRDYGLKKIRRIGQTMEFEQIKDYVTGDDVRNINWKASAKRNQLMINQFQDEKSQPVYSVIDKGRVMKMPFEELKLVDYAINSTLVISNIALKKGDKAGMFSFSDKVSNQVMAQKRASQMNLILETLYNLDTDFKESDFARLYIDIKRSITQRSLLLLYTNFETMDALHRQLPYLQAIAKNHLLVVIFFENTELKELVKQ